MKPKSGWIDATLLRDFEAEGTDAHRLCTIEDGWVERFGRDVLISFKRVLAREHLIQELHSWAKIVRFDVGRIFARFIPRKSEEREPPSLIIADDVMAVLPRLARKGEKFDMIILDPPTFSRSAGGKTFHVENDFEKLLVSALELTERDGHILVSTNCSALREHALEVMARYGLKAGRRAGIFHRQPPLPDFPVGAGASSIWVILR